MKDKNNKIATFDKNKRNIIELGCGPNRRFKDSITIDIVDLDTVDVIANVDNGLSFIPDNSIDEIHSIHFLEHVRDLVFVMSEIHRILKPGGRKIGSVPHFSNPYFYSDYTHKAFFGLYTFYYMSKTSSLKRKVPTFYNELDFKIIEIKFKFNSPFRFRNYLRRIYQRLFNFSKYAKEYYEENLCYLFPAQEIFFILEKK